MLAHVLFFSFFAVCVAGPSQVVRPCRLNHLQCMTDNFKGNSQCNPNVRGAMPSSYKIPQFSFHTPAFNASYIDNNLIIRNHNKCFVSEFFFNIQSDTGVLAIDCPNLEFQSTRTLIQHSSLREDTSYSYDYQGLYPLIRLTVNLPNAGAMDLCKSLAFADVTALPLYKINPNDQQTANFLSRDLTLLGFFESESMWWRANSLIRYYINSMICDFGCNF